VNTGLMLHGGALGAIPASLYALGSSMVALKLLSKLNHEDNQHGASSKAWISLFFLSAAFCFKYRPLELMGGI